MPYEPRVVAGVEITPLCDAVGPMGPPIRKPLPEMFAGSSFGPDEEWVLHFHCFLLRAGGRTVLVDTGIGGADSPATWAPLPGRLGAELAAAGVAPADVDVVVVTHLHSDHAGGCVVDGAPAYPNARYLLQRAEVEWASGPVRERIILPLGDRVDVVDGDAEPVPGVRVLHAPGHTPGHQCVQVGDVLMSGDLLHHPAQLADPTIRYVYDEDPDLAVRTRRSLLARAAVLAPAHFPQPFIALSN
ncbi:MBL fold metallo-hydrolase [Microbispora triticiradicis]|uniref:MBL fold metallo-hydrolase n=2 Tax=Microbispora TaxID=2005 RepID=A0ABY3M5X6_9ACTN|nr:MULTISPECIES: MBL fold metallo-hydrolase [Microbispora]TLP66313.1 MBL fold metallo-hydrolase [Microbispora fusca]TYB68097.1 MBL fold metallo-hydrolase [Microbispora tritici]